LFRYAISSHTKASENKYVISKGQEQELFRPETIIVSLTALKMQRLQTKELGASVFILDVMANYGPLTVAPLLTYELHTLMAAILGMT
jgi:hypothetical protein